ncbi:XdhC family protein [Agrobacterium tumefaciens]|uniref:XdhC family protein n=1 Tax=Agrobacterium tumefaciens TaxID=358 RepID=UPI00287DE39A|nr:XdhC family protein [Agrobacterium tumefaciens]MDS7595463.1 XdhC family protein [Agrobacterium tumefaciens]
MNSQTSATLIPTPIRVSFADTPFEILEFAVSETRRGMVALATLVEIVGGAARGLGSHVAVAADGRFCGYVSGGCVEAAVATEALLAIQEGRDRIVRFGEGSPFFDIVLPCGGGIAIAIHLLKEPSVLEQILGRLQRRQLAGMIYTPAEGKLEEVVAYPIPGWKGSSFVSIYGPRTRIVISGRGAEAAALRRLGKAAGYEVWDDGASGASEPMIDAYTAVAILHHDIDAEHHVTEAALRSPAFYIGALGSTRTHRRRTQRLQGMSWSLKDIERIRAPIGSFGPTKDATSLALSILADITACRLMAYGSAW